MEKNPKYYTYFSIEFGKILFEKKYNIITEMLTADNAINFVNNIMKFLRIVFLDLKSKKTILYGKPIISFSAKK